MDESDLFAAVIDPELLSDVPKKDLRRTLPIELMSEVMKYEKYGRFKSYMQSLIYEYDELYTRIIMCYPNDLFDTLFNTSSEFRQYYITKTGLSHTKFTSLTMLKYLEEQFIDWKTHWGTFMEEFIKFYDNHHATFTEEFIERCNKNYETLLKKLNVVEFDMSDVD